MARLLALLVLMSAWALAARAQELVPLPPQPDGLAFPTAAWDRAEPGADVDRAALAKGIDDVFEEQGPAGIPDGRALVAVHRGRIVAERYASGFGPDTPFHSWSMAKSVTQALAAILVREGRLALDAPAPVAQWQGADDPRREITFDHMLRMTTGLANGDGFDGSGAGAYVARLIFGPEALDQAAFARDVSLVHPPGTFWAYSTATSTLVARAVQDVVGGSKADMLRFMRDELFEPLGITTAVPEFDAAGTYSGGGFLWMGAHDWARFGYLYLRDGVWDGRRILPEGWLDYTRTPAPAENNGVHSAHFWLNTEPADDQFRVLHGGPVDTFAASGAYGQYVLIVPSRDLVVVRLGEMHEHTFPQMGEELAGVLAAFPPATDGAAR